MFFIRLALIFLLQISFPVLAYSASSGVRWDFTSSIESWTVRDSNTHLTHSSDNGGQLNVYMYGSDPAIVSPDISMDADSNEIIRAYIWTYCPDLNAQLYFKRSGSSSTYSGDSISLSSGPSGGTYEFDMSSNSNWYGTITQIRIDPAGSCGSTETYGYAAFKWIESDDVVPVIAPTLVSPIDGETVSSSDSTVTLEWNQVSGAVGYELWVDGIEVLVGSGSTTSKSATLGYGPHQWKARAQNSSGDYGSWSSSESFTLSESALSPPTLVSPIDGETVSSSDSTVTLEWNQVSGAAGYELWVDGLEVLVKSGNTTSNLAT
ncbi:MAG: hypothetical protein HQL52_14885, partial [Magnetococcales bacterium]|nr:hypothetical protein [Magnetococcales bacterium]